MIQNIIDSLTGIGGSILQRLTPKSGNDLLAIYSDIELVLPKVAFLLTDRADNLFGNFFPGKYKSIAFYIYGKIYFLSNFGVQMSSPREYIPNKNELAVITPLSSVMDMPTWRVLESNLVGFSSKHYHAFGDILGHLIYQVKGSIPTSLLPLYNNPHTFYRKIVMDNNFWVVKLFSCKALQG